MIVMYPILCLLFQIKSGLFFFFVDFNWESRLFRRVQRLLGEGVGKKERKENRERENAEAGSLPVHHYDYYQQHLLQLCHSMSNQSNLSIFTPIYFKAVKNLLFFKRS